MRVLFTTGACLLVLAACTAPAAVPTGTATPTAIQLGKTAKYFVSSASVTREYLTTLDMALETASVDSTMTIVESLDAGAANLRRLSLFQNDVEDLVRHFESNEQPSAALAFDNKILESLLLANDGVHALLRGYVNYATDREFPTVEDLEYFAKQRAIGEDLLKNAAGKAAEALEESNRLLARLLSELDQADNSEEQKYDILLSPTVDRFYHHRKEYNAGLERIREQVRSARTEAEQRSALEKGVAHLERVHRWFRRDRDDFVVIVPPSRFREFHLLMNSALRDFVEATNAFITYYSTLLKQGTQDLVLADRASALVRTANENLQRAGYMYAELRGQR